MEQRVEVTEVKEPLEGPLRVFRVKSFSMQAEKVESVSRQLGIQLRAGCILVHHQLQRIQEMGVVCDIPLREPR